MSNTWKIILAALGGAALVFAYYELISKKADTSDELPEKAQDTKTA